MKCIFCQSIKSKASFYPIVLFNDKQFEYRECTECNLLYLNLLPQEEDYIKMYPISYQSGVDKTLSLDDQKKLIGLRYSYGEHYKLINTYAPGKTVADYGCGNGNFLFNASQKGYKMDGIEYNPSLLLIMKETFPNSSFFTPAQFFLDTKKYDVIRMSNVLEHLPDPQIIIQKLQAKLNPSGILLIEGPLEDNLNLAYILRKYYFSFKKHFQKSWHFSTPPTHIFFSNAQNQKQVFEANGLETLYYNISEAEWPFPEKIALSNGLGYFAKSLLAKISMLISSLISQWGNTFIYVGKSKK